jgi:hypothetical protein
MPSNTIQVLSDGRVQFIYSDELSEMLDLPGCESVSITRASHVEPTADGRWTADMKPMLGPILGPFATRAAALSAEVDWLDAKLFGSN